MGVLYGVLIVVILLFSVAVHEAGHLTTAKHYGMKATQYFVGFGPTIFSFRRGETEYGLKAIPAGGFVKIIGMNPLEKVDEDAPDDPMAAAEAVAALPTDLAPDGRRLFYTYPARQRSVVLAAGSFMHGVLALALCFAGLLIGGNFNASFPTPTIDGIEQCINASANGTCGAGSTETAAYKAGLVAGDKIVAINGTTITNWTQLTKVIEPAAGKVLTLTVEHDGTTRTVAVTIGTNKVLDAAGNPTNKTEGFLGVEPSFATPSYSVAGAAGEVLPFLGDDLRGTGSILGHLPSEVWTILQGKPRSASSSALSVVGVVRVTAQIGGTSGVSNGEKIANLLLIGGELNLFVGIFNLLPLLPLDGGHIGIIGYEKLRLFLARRRGRADPGRVNLLKVLPTAYGVFGLIVAVSALLIYADIFNPVRGV